MVVEGLCPSVACRHVGMLNGTLADAARGEASFCMSQSELSGMSVVVTGASRGIGRAIALELARGGASVLVHARQSRLELDDVASEIRSLGTAVETVLGDLADQEAQDELVARAFAWRDVDAWINNAGVDVLTGAEAAWAYEKKLAALWSVDVVATMRLARAAGERMRRRGLGCIVNMGWDHAESGMEGESGGLFAAVKGAVMSFSRSLAHSLAPHVRVNCLAPGWIRTGWGESAPHQWQRRAEHESLLARWGTPGDVASVCRFLVSPAAAFVTGQIVVINGGLK
jgi:3-oxoacyl-[acyl-carrier protein] reductase